MSAESAIQPEPQPPFRSQPRAPTHPPFQTSSITRQSHLRPPSRPFSPPPSESILFSSREQAWQSPLSSDVFLSRSNPNHHPRNRHLFINISPLDDLQTRKPELQRPYSPSISSGINTQTTSDALASSFSSSLPLSSPSSFFRPPSSPPLPSSDFYFHPLDPSYSLLWHSNHSNSVSHHNQYLSKGKRQYFDCPQAFPCWKTRMENMMMEEMKEEEEEGKKRKESEGRRIKWKKKERGQLLSHRQLRFQLTDPQLERKFRKQQKQQQEERDEPQQYPQQKPQERPQQPREEFHSSSNDSSLHSRAVAALSPSPHSNSQFGGEERLNVYRKEEHPHSAIPSSFSSSSSSNFCPSPSSSSSLFPIRVSISSCLSGACPVVCELNESLERFGIHQQLMAKARMNQQIGGKNRKGEGDSGGGGGGIGKREGKESSPRTRRLSLYRMAQSDPSYRAYLNQLEKSWNSKHSLRND